MMARLWTISAVLDQKVKDEQKYKEENELNEAFDLLAEIKAYEHIDEGTASYAGEY